MYSERATSTDVVVQAIKSKPILPPSVRKVLLEYVQILIVIYTAFFIKTVEDKLRAGIEHVVLHVMLRDAANLIARSLAALRLVAGTLI